MVESGSAVAVVIAYIHIEIQPRKKKSSKKVFFFFGLSKRNWYIMPRRVPQGAGIKNKRTPSTTTPASLSPFYHKSGRACVEFSGGVSRVGRREGKGVGSVWWGVPQAGGRSRHGKTQEGDRSGTQRCSECSVIV